MMMDDEANQSQLELLRFCGEKFKMPRMEILESERILLVWRQLGLHNDQKMSLYLLFKVGLVRAKHN
jgi:hypothetical protein